MDFNLHKISNQSLTESALKSVKIIKVRSFMMEAIPISNKILITYSARVWLFTSVSSLMVDKACLVVERLLATFMGAFKHLRTLIQRVVLYC